VALEHLDHLGEVGQAPRQAVDLVDHHDVDQPALDIGHQALQGRALGVAAGVAGVVVVVGHRNPALGALAGDEGVPGFLLRIDGVELLVEPLVRRHPAVDRTALARLGGGDFRHQAPPFRPKNSGPLQCWPVMCRATAVRLLEAAAFVFEVTIGVNRHPVLALAPFA